MQHYTVQKLAKLAGVSVRTLHHYDQIGLLSPSRNEDNGYRVYGQKELARLQQIMLFKELEFPLDQIQQIIDAPTYEPIKALEDQKKILTAKKQRLTRLINTIEQMINAQKRGEHMNDQDMFKPFSMEEMNELQEEAKKRWGESEAWKQSQERTKHWTKEDYKRIAEDGKKFTQKLADVFTAGTPIESDEVQQLIDQHHAGIEVFYDCPLDMYRNLGQMYIDDPRFTAYYDKFAPGLAVFVRDAIFYYCDTRNS